MYRAIFLLIILLIKPMILLGAEPDTDTSMYWPQWRGPLGTGGAPAGNPPVEWSETKNIRWKTRLPGELFASRKGRKTRLSYQVHCIGRRPHKRQSEMGAFGT